MLRNTDHQSESNVLEDELEPSIPTPTVKQPSNLESKSVEQHPGIAEDRAALSRLLDDILSR